MGLLLVRVARRVREVIHKLETMNGGIIGVAGLQGVGKSSALLAILSGRMLLQHKEYRKAHIR